MTGRGRLSSIDLLPAEAEADVVWACQELFARKREQTEILDEFNARLAAKGIEPISKSAFSRYSLRKARAQKRMAEARDLYRGMAETFETRDVDEANIALGEYLKTLIQELLDAGDEMTPKAAMELARAFASVVSAQKISVERVAKLKREMAERTAAAIRTVAAERGISEDTYEAIKARVLGVALDGGEAVA